MHSIRFYLRNIKNNKVFSAITIGSFVISLTIIIILSSFIVSEFSYDSHIRDIDRIYIAAASKNGASIPEQSRLLMLSQIPEIESVTNFLVGSVSVVYNAQDFNIRLINSDEGIFSVLPIVFRSGNPSGIFNVKTNAVITKGLAKRIFGDTDPIGKTLIVSHKENLTIAGVIDDFPQKSTLTGDIICSAELRVIYSQSCYNDNCTTFYSELVKLKQGTSYETVSAKVAKVIPKMNEKDDNTYSLLPYKGVYFNTLLSHDGLMHCNLKLLRLLILLTLVLLLMSVFNYVNLSVANNISRSKEFGVKQALGAGAFKIFNQFLFETFLTILFSALIALALANIFKPLFTDLLGKDFSLAELFSKPAFIFDSLGALVLIAILSAIYPARMAMKTEAKDLLHKKIKGRGNTIDLRKSLNVIQFVATISIIISLIVITRQIRFVKNKDFGFSTGQLIEIPYHWKAANRADLIKSELGAIPGVRSVCYSHGIPGSIQTYNNNDENGKVDMITTDKDFTETFGLRIIAGRNFFEGEQGKVCLINTQVMRQSGWNTIEGKKMFGFDVVGLVDDFNYESLYNKIGGLMIANGKDVSNFSLRLLPDNIPLTLAAIESTFKKILPDYEYTFRFYDEFLDSMYRQEEKRAEAIKIISILTILISCIGLIGLVEYSTRYRIKEIGVRKVNGATIAGIMMMLDMDFVRWIAFAFIVATPVGWLVMNRWLNSFAYRTELSWWIFVAAGLLTLGIALLTVSWQSWRAATRNPVEALRYE
jgi:putative ABC transport system permease protein